MGGGLVMTVGDQPKVIEKSEGSNEVRDCANPLDAPKLLLFQDRWSRFSVAIFSPPSTLERQQHAFFSETASALIYL